jgi:hypothetical protein
MIEVAARATRGVKIPGRKQTRQSIINMFKKQMQALRDRLNVCLCSLAITIINHPAVALEQDCEW